MVVLPATFPEDLPHVIRLFRAYAESLPIDLGYQDFEAEIAGLPGKYGPPSGALLLAWHKEGVAKACIALRPLEPGVCEMKRLYVDPSERGLGVGRVLVTAILEEAANLGYKEMRLDTLPTMAGAIGIYREFGFKEIEAYYETPIAGTLFFSQRFTPLRR